MEITKMLTLSTAHITEETAKRLERDPEDNNLGLCVYKKSDYGFFIYLTPDTNGRLPQYYEFLPEDLCKCISLTHEVGCSVLCLDCDGEVVPFLEVYEW